MRLLKPTIFMLLAAVTSVHADTLHLRNGQAVKGTFMSASSRQIQFMGGDGQVRAYTINDVASVSFDKPAPPPPPPASSSAAPRQVSVPAGTRILVRMIDTVDSSQHKTGHRFTASLDSNLQVNGAVVARKGTTVYGRVVEAEAAGRMAGSSKLVLELTDILLGGTARPLLTDKYELKGSGEGKKTARKVVGGAGLGAAIGAIAGGGDGAATGAAIGATVGTVGAAAKKGEQVRVPSETLLEFRLQQPTTLPVGG